MCKLSLILGLVLLAFWGQAQENPHGKTLKFDCVDCHTTEGWTFSAATAKFSHDSTRFILEGQHWVTDCKSCHTTLVFSEAKTNCMDCHTDMHNNTVGLDCARCHDARSWIVSNITEIHQQSRFPLLGAHNTVECSACHTSVSQLEFQPLGVECVDCHRQDFLATTSPNHVQSGFSTDCIECHKIDANEWSSAGFNHDFFPLTQGHDITECSACHTNGLSEPLSPDCFSCHQQNYSSTTNPAHQSLNFSTTCTDCHTTETGWKPARFELHDDLYFPVYSGIHRGEWDNCTDCHTQPETYTLFSCVDCHEHNRSDTDREHNEVSGYSYSSTACYACHPMGREEGAFNHDATGFPLKGAHIQAQCLDCHTDGYAGISNTCSSCHQSNYEQTVNPGHNSIGIPNTCEECHTIDPGWQPALFPIHNDYYALNGAHATVANDCYLCHEGNYSNTLNTCYGCHSTDYNNTNDPSHTAAQFPTDCTACHGEIAWAPSTFNHDGQYFSIYSGRHQGTWNSCAACHTQPANYAAFSCITCHEHNQAETDSHHGEVGNYVYTSTSCYDCHPTGVAEDD